MSPVRLFFSLVFLAMGILAILDAAGTIAWSQTFEEWWPAAIVGWGLADMLAGRRVSLGGAVVITIGLALLADEQAWVVEPLLWSALFMLAAAAILIPAAHKKTNAPEDRAVDSAASAPQA